MLNPPALSTALLKDDPIVSFLCDLKTPVCCFVPDRLALQKCDQERELMRRSMITLLVILAPPRKDAVLHCSKSHCTEV